MRVFLPGRVQGTVTLFHSLQHALQSLFRHLDMPELLRLKGCFLASCSALDDGRVDACLSQALLLARRQRALAWELRIATTRAHVQATALAIRQLGRTCERFTEGTNTLDHRTAGALLVRLTPRMTNIRLGALQSKA